MVCLPEDITILLFLQGSEDRLRQRTTADHAHHQRDLSSLHLLSERICQLVLLSSKIRQTLLLVLHERMEFR